MTTTEQNLENQLIRLAQHKDKKQEQRKGAGWFRWFKKQAYRQFKSAYLEDTFGEIFRKMQEALGVQEEDLKLESANFHSRAGNLYVHYYRSSSPFEVLTCNINDRTLELTKSYGNYQMTLNMQNIPRSHSTLSVRTELKNNEITEAQCQELKILFSQMADFIHQYTAAQKQ